jgi:hypothetical protein
MCTRKPDGPRAVAEQRLFHLTQMGIEEMTYARVQVVRLPKLSDGRQCGLRFSLTRKLVKLLAWWRLGHVKTNYPFRSQHGRAC